MDSDTIRFVLQKDASCLSEENQLERGTLEEGRLVREWVWAVRDEKSAMPSTFLS